MQCTLKPTIKRALSACFTLRAFYSICMSTIANFYLESSILAFGPFERADEFLVKR